MSILESKQSFFQAIKQTGIEANRFKICMRTDNLGYCANISIGNVDSTRFDFAIKIVPEEHVFVLWDCRLRRSEGGPDGCYLSHKAFYQINPSQDSFEDIYKDFRPNRTRKGYEKVLVIGENRFYSFFDHFYEHVQLNPYDKRYLPRSERLDLIDPLPADQPPNRKRVSTKAYARDSVFRSMILEEYGSRCAICRLDIIEALEAAHKHGFTVAEGHFFEPEHGICLCRNHHVMYDRGLFEIDFENGKLISLSERVENQPWFERFVRDYDAKLITPQLIKHD